jgi:threonine dehydrogenase-like Zn-dependent dehydrogenase
MCEPLSCSERAYGADTVVNASTEDPVEAVLAATSGRGVDVAAEFVGLQKTISQAVDVLATGGRAVVVGPGPDPILGPPPTVFVRKEASIIASYASSRTAVERLVALAASGALDLAARSPTPSRSTKRMRRCRSCTARTTTRCASSSGPAEGTPKTRVSAHLRAYQLRMLTRPCEW